MKAPPSLPLPKRVIPLFEKEGSGKILNGEGDFTFYYPGGCLAISNGKVYLPRTRYFPQDAFLAKIFISKLPKEPFLEKYHLKKWVIILGSLV